LQVAIDRDRASDLGVNVLTVASTLQVMVGGQVVSDYKDPELGELYDVWLRAESPDRDNRKVIETLTIPSTKAGLIKLSNVASLREDRGPAQIDRFARQRKITIVANLAPATEGRPAYTTDAAIQSFNAAFAELQPPADYQLIASGRAKTQAESNAAFLVALVLSLIFMYMILAAQFESFVHPITILLAVPLTIPFALLSLIFLQQALNIYSILGVFLLFGIVKKNGILQVDYTNVLRGRAREDPAIVPAPFRQDGDGNHATAAVNGNGHGAAAHGALVTGRWNRWAASLPQARRIRLWAIVEANRTRLRPILMTTLMLIAGMVPIALGQGPGASSRASMAKVIVGGQALSLLLSLLVTPVAYSLFDDITLLLRRRKRKQVVVAPLAEPVPAPAEAPELVGADSI
jgi:hydrophobic/amphiphilic exporter-1 (mainly G- bacteria), HAE1 family